MSRFRNNPGSYKDIRYIAASLYISSGKAASLSDIFLLVPRSKIARDININSVRFMNKVNDPSKFSVKEIIIIAELFQVSEYLIYKLIRPNCEIVQSENLTPI